MESPRPRTTAPVVKNRLLSMRLSGFFAILILGFLALTPAEPLPLPASPARPEVQDQGFAVACCFATNPGAATLGLFETLLSVPAGSGDFQVQSRWASTTLSGGGLGQGDPTILTYSFVPDGTNVPSATGEAAAPSDLFARFNSVYGSPAVWQQIFHDQFGAWSAISGLTFQYEPNDDGAALYTTAGSAGVRGDIRISAKLIDGNLNTLAFNLLPTSGGDMVIDSMDSFLNNTSADSRLLRNLISHESGHGLGLLHVCPLGNTKLMEPVINTVFLGPQIDEIRGVQRLYGDAFEPDDTLADAQSLGVLPDGLTTLAGRSTDDDADRDLIPFDLGPNKEISITLRPVGGTYGESGLDMNGLCMPVMLIAADAISDLRFELRDAATGNLLASEASAGIGVNETLLNFVMPTSGGSFYLEVIPDATDDIQLYEVDINVATIVPPNFQIQLASPAPPAILAERPFEIDLSTTFGGSAPDPSRALLHYSVDGAPFRVFPLTHLGGQSFQAQLPPLAAYERLRWYLEIGEFGLGTSVLLPASAPTQFFEAVAEPDSADVVVAFQDGFTQDLGWTVTNDPTLLDGAWERGIPQGGGVRGDPVADFDGDGWCYLTDNVPGNSDVDGGPTILTSPVLDLSSVTDARISWAMWFDNDFGQNPNSHQLVIEITDDGTLWVPVEAYGASVDQWVSRQIRVRDFVEPTATVQLRFVADDSGPSSIYEAAVDAVRVDTVPFDRLGPWADGLVDLGGLGPVDVLLIDGLAGGSNRTVVVPRNQTFSFDVISPPAATAPAHFVIFGRIGVPSVNERFLADPQIGALAFLPCILFNNAPYFTLADNLTGNFNCPRLLPSTPAPWSYTIPGGLPIPATATFQGVIVDGATFRATNAVILEIP